MKTQAIRISAHGGPEVLQYVEVEVPDPGPDEVRVRHRAIGVNFIDIYYRTGLYASALPHAWASRAPAWWRQSAATSGS